MQMGTTAWIYAYRKKSGLIMSIKKHWFGLLVKRTFDFVMSSVMLIILSPVFLTLAIWIKRDSVGAGILPPGTGDTVWTKDFDLQVSHYGAECRPNRKPGDCRRRCQNY